MKLTGSISDILWEAVKVNFEAEKYSDAIHDSIKVLRDILREKSGSTEDGISLVAFALGSKAPKQPRLKLNPNLTSSQQSEQEGYQDLLRGVFHGIRNPREHDQVEDSRESAIAIILFIDHLIGKIEKTEPVFSVTRVVRMIGDHYFDKDPDYLAAMLNKIPKAKHCDILFELYDSRKRIAYNRENLSFAVQYIFRQLQQTDQKRYLEVISESFVINKYDSLAIDLIYLPKGTWNQIDTVARMRMEYMAVEILSTEFDQNWGHNNITYGLKQYIISALKFLTEMNRKDEIVEIIKNTIIYGRYIPIYCVDFISGLLNSIETNLEDENKKVFWGKIGEIISKLENESNNSEEFYDLKQEIAGLNRNTITLIDNGKLEFTPPKNNTDFDFGDLSDDDFLDF